MGFIESLLTKVLVALLQYFQGREDLKARVRAEIESAGLKDANHALGYKADALSRPDGGASLRVSSDKHLVIQGNRPDPGDGSNLPRL